jgi:hypothetical protein
MSQAKDVGSADEYVGSWMNTEPRDLRHPLASLPVDPAASRQGPVVLRGSLFRVTGTRCTRTRGGGATLQTATGALPRLRNKDMHSQLCSLPGWEPKHLR